MFSWIARFGDLFWTRVEVERTNALLQGLISILIKKGLLSEEDAKNMLETALMASSNKYASGDLEYRAKRISYQTYSTYLQEENFKSLLRNYREKIFKTQYNPYNYDEY